MHTVDRTVSALKTNAGMHVHGVDGVHASVLQNGNMALYFGESKLYSQVNSAIDNALESLAPYLLDAGGGDAERDIYLLRDHVDTGDKQLTDALVRYFTEDTIEAAKVEVRGAVLVGFNLENYPDPHEEDGITIRAEASKALKDWHARTKAAVDTNKIEKFEIEVFLVPLPSVQEFRDLLKTELGLR